MKRLKGVVLASIFCCGFTQTTQATPSPIVAELMREALEINPKNLAVLIEETTKNNPTIRAAHDRWMAEKQIIPQARSLPDPKINWSYFTLEGNNADEKVLQGLELFGAIQEVPFPGKLYKRWQVAKINADKADAEYFAQTISIISQLKRKFYDLYFVNRTIHILEHNQALLETMQQQAEQQYGAQQAPEQDVLRAQTELTRFEMRLVSLQQEQQSLITDINAIVNRNLDINVTTPAQLPITPFDHKAEELNEAIMQRSPHLHVRRKNVEQAKETIALNKMDYFSDFELEGEKVRDKVIGADGYQFVVKATFPLYFLDKQNKAVKESVARYHATLEEFQGTYQDLGYRVKNAFLIIHRTNKLIKLLQGSLLPQAKKTFMSSQLAYRTGNVDFYTMLNNLLTLQQNEIELEAEIIHHEKQITEIEEALGIFL